MIDYELAFNVIVSISTIMIFFAIFLLWYYIAYFILANSKVKDLPHSDDKTNFAVIIAARNESKVIRGILDSLKKQTYDSNFFIPWIIVEDINDPTVKIVEEYGYRYFVRDRLTSARRTKGFAIQELYDYFVREDIKYDSFLIFDADNILDANYIELMNDLRQTGVKVGLGYRNFTNAKKNWLTSCSAVMFAYMNQVTSRGRSYLFHKATLMGTGYFVDRQIIEDAGGWIFTGMTEDIQLTAYCYYHDVYMRYYPKAYFYDEQSPYFKDVHNQHVRWLSGFFASRRFLKRCGIKYVFHNRGNMFFMRAEFRVGIIPFILYNIVNCLLLIASIALSIACIFFKQDQVIRCWGLTIYQFLALFLPFVIASVYVLITERKQLKIKGLPAVVCVLTYIFFFYDFLVAFLDIIFSKKKRSSWTKIEHTGEIDHADLENSNESKL